MKTVGILGGMGPEATVDLMARVIRSTPADDDADHIRMLVDNNPKVPSRIKAIIDGTGESPAPCLVEMALGLQRQGADFLVMPCNTAHFYFDEIAQAISIPFVNLIELTVETAASKVSGLERAGLLASTAVQLTSLYGQRFNRRSVEALFPPEQCQDQIMDLIRSVKSGAFEEDDILGMNQAAKDLEGEGAQCLIIACTELSVVSDRLRTNLPVLDTSQILADYIVQAAS
jgi:aspartate racemase